MKTTAIDGPLRPAAYEDDYRSAFHCSKDAVAIIADGAIPTLTDVTPGFADLLQLHKSDVVGRPVAEIFLDPWAKNLARLIHDVTNSAQASSMLLRNVGTTNFYFPTISARLAPLPSGKVSLGLSVPANSRARTIAALLEDIGAIHGGLITIYDPTSHKTRYINPGMAGFLGVDLHHSLSVTDIMDIVHPDEHAIAQRLINSLSSLKDGEVLRESLRVRRHDGVWRWIDTRIFVLKRAASGEVVRVLAYSHDVTDAQQAKDDLKSVTAALASAKQDERWRIARDLHDFTAQHVVAADLSIAAFERRHDVADQTLGAARQVLSSALREIRTLSFLYKAPNSNGHGFAATLRALAEGFAKRAEFELIDDICDSSGVSVDAEEVLLSVAQEALMNVYRHAGADRVKLRLSKSNNKLVLQIEDNGTGIGNAEQGGVGIESMRTRLRGIGGTLQIEARRIGTLVTATAPWPEAPLSH